MSLKYHLLLTKGIPLLSITSYLCYLFASFLATMALALSNWLSGPGHMEEGSLISKVIVALIRRRCSPSSPQGQLTKNCGVSRLRRLGVVPVVTSRCHGHRWDAACWVCLLDMGLPCHCSWKNFLFSNLIRSKRNIPDNVPHSFFHHGLLPTFG